MDAITRMIFFLCQQRSHLAALLTFSVQQKNLTDRVSLCLRQDQNHKEDLVFFKIFPLLLCHYIIDTDGHMCTYLACSIFSRCMWKHTARWQCMPQFNILNIVHGCGIDWISPARLFRMMGFPRPCLSSSLSWSSEMQLSPCFCSLQSAVLCICSHAILKQLHKHVFRGLVVVTAWLSHVHHITCCCSNFLHPLCNHFPLVLYGNVSFFMDVLLEHRKPIYILILKEGGGFKISDWIRDEG